MSTIPRRDALALVAGGLATTVTFIRQIRGQVIPPGHSNNSPAFAEEVVNVLAHGATGDGITDDTAAITAALAAAASGGHAIAPVIFPIGTYLVPNGITTSTKGLTVIGLGHRNMRAAGAPLTGTILKTTAAGKWTWEHDGGGQVDLGARHRQPGLRGLPLRGHHLWGHPRHRRRSPYLGLRHRLDPALHL